MVQCLQYDTNSEELKLDVKHVFQLLGRDPEHVHLNNLEHHKVPGLVDEALHVLYSKQHSAPVRIYCDSCVVISLIFHWVVTIMCKRLMQLMIAEALPAVRKCIPAYYIEHYLKFQNHFSLKCLISKHLTSVEQRNGYVHLHDDYQTLKLNSHYFQSFWPSNKTNVLH